ncbi:MAG: hypothetical protein V3R99_09070 [Thermoguttaceae bacterium]
MIVPTPHYLLYSQTSHESGLGYWQFTLRRPDGSKRFEAADVEPAVEGERLDLLTVIRALESLDEPSRVTLVGCSQSIRRGVQYGLPEWRSNGWRWEFYGRMVPVKNGDLWQRFDSALQFHHLEYGRQQSESVASVVRDLPMDRACEGSSIRIDGPRWLIYRLYRLFPASARYRRRLAAMARMWRRVVQSWLPPVPYGETEPVGGVG